MSDLYMDAMGTCNKCGKQLWAQNVHLCVFEDKFVHGQTDLTLPETTPLRPVLQDWVCRISLRMQGVLVLALRGPDGASKESELKTIVRNLRGCVMNSGRECKPMKLGTAFDGDSFMRTVEIANSGDLWQHEIDKFCACADSMNVHFYQHILHAAAIAGCYHWDHVVRENWWKLYEAGVRRLHMKPETRQELEHRLREGHRPAEDE